MWRMVVLAGAVRADEGDDFAFVNVEVDAFDGLNHTVVYVEVGNFKHFTHLIISQICLDDLRFAEGFGGFAFG